MRNDRSEVIEVIYSQPLSNKINYYMNSTRGERELSWAITDHAQKRISQRVKNYENILLTLEYGDTIFKQNLCFYIATNKSIPENIDSKMRENTLNTVVVTSSDGAIITCYKSSNALKNIRKKSCQLV